jgi:hypothetical protein
MTAPMEGHVHQTFAVIAITAYLTLLTYQVGTDLFGAETIGEVVVKYQTLIAGAFASLSVYAVLRQIAEEKRRYTHGVKRSNDREFRALVDLLAELQSGRFETRELPDGELGFGILWPFGLLLPHLGEVFSRHLFEHSTPRVNERLRRFNEAVSDTIKVCKMPSLVKAGIGRPSSTAETGWTRSIKQC